MDELDDIIKQEIYFELQEIEDTASEEFNALLLWIVNALRTGKTIKAIKRYIRSQDVDSNLNENLTKFLTQQSENITGDDKEFNLGLETVAGLTFLEIIAERKLAIRKRATRFMAQAKERLKTEAGIQKFIREEFNRFEKNTELFWRTNAKAGREYGYQEVDRASKEQIRGWMSIAVLDNRTSAICVGLHNKFYSIKNYKRRGDVPDKPPRHPNCRSIVITVWKGTDIRQFKGENLNTFLKRNPETAKDIMGIEKHRLWSEGRAKIDKYIDLKGKRFYRNDEIVKRLGIKSKKRLIK